MKLFNLRATPEQRADQTIQLRVLYLFLLIFITVLLANLGLDAAFGTIPHSLKAEDFPYWPCIIILIDLIPSVLKYSWKVLIPKTIIISVIVAVFAFALNRIW